MAEVNITTQIALHVHRDSVTITLPTSTLVLDFDEAETLHCTLQNDLIGDVVLAQFGEELPEIVHVADVPLRRAEAWEVNCLLDNVFFPESEEEPEYIPEESQLPDVYKFDWRIEGF